MILAFVGLSITKALGKRNMFSLRSDTMLLRHRAGISAIKVLESLANVDELHTKLQLIIVWFSFHNSMHSDQNSCLDEFMCSDSSTVRT